MSSSPLPPSTAAVPPPTYGPAAPAPAGAVDHGPLDDGPSDGQPTGDGASGDGLAGDGLAGVGPAVDAPAVERCVSCDRPSHTPYCPWCGERRAADRPRGVVELLGEAWEAFVALDGRVARSLVTLFRRPGALTVVHVRGERVRWVGPLRLFLLVNVVYFFLTTFDTYSTPLRTHVARTEHRAVATRLVERRLAERRVTFAEYARTFDRATHTQARTLVIAMVPGFALAVGLVGWRRRRGWIHHAVFALHAMSAVLLGSVIFYRLLLPATRLWERAGLPLTSGGLDEAVSTFLSVVFGVYVYHALRRAYGDGRMGAAVKAFVLVQAYWQVLFAYRALLFFVTYYTT